MNTQLLFRKILSDLRVEVLDEFNSNFTRKAFFDRPWPARKMDTGRGTLLVVSGAMRRSLRCTAARGSLYFSSELPYFSIHNRGGKVPVTPAMRRYFWAMYYRNVPPEGATGKRADRKSRTAAYYRSLALTKKTEFDIPRRQVVGDHPAVGRIVRDTCERNVREWVANIFFYRKGDTTIMVDAGYNYDRLAEKMSWLGIDPKSIHHILITHQDTDHVGAVEADSPGLFRNAKLYIGEIENRYLTGEVRRKVIYHLYKLPQVTINNEKVLLHDGQVLDIDGVRIECFLVPGHTWGHMVYLIDDKYLFTGDTLWFGADGGYSFISALAEDNKLAVKSLALLEKKLKKRGLHPLFITGHTGWTDNMEFAFAHKNELCSPFKKKVHDPSAPYDAYDESDDTEENAKSGFLKGVGR